jgi:hypothetical protein
MLLFAYTSLIPEIPEESSRDWGQPHIRRDIRVSKKSSEVEDTSCTARKVCRKRSGCAGLFRHGAQRARARPNNYFFCQLIPSLPPRGRGAAITRSKNEKSKIGKIEFSQITKTQKQKTRHFSASQTLLCNLQECALRSTCASDDVMGQPCPCAIFPRRSAIEFRCYDPHRPMPRPT